MVHENPMTRQFDGLAVPQVGRYAIDPAHSTIEATVRHLMIAKVRGGFTRFAGDIVVAEDVRASRVDLEIEADSIDTRDDRRDAHLRSPDFLDVGDHPIISFRSASVERQDGHWSIAGDLTIRGVSRQVRLDTEFLGATIDHRDRHRIAFTGSTRIDRDDFGMTWNQSLEAGGVVVGRALDVTLEVQALRSEV